MKKKYYYFDYTGSGARCYTNPAPSKLEQLRRYGTVLLQEDVKHLQKYPPEYWMLNDSKKAVLAPEGVRRKQVQRKNEAYKKKIDKAQGSRRPITKSSLNTLKYLFYLQTLLVVIYVGYKERQTLYRIYDYIRILF